MKPVANITGYWRFLLTERNTKWKEAHEIERSH